MIELARDEARAREALHVPLAKLRGLLQMWTHFQSAILVTQEFLNSFEELSFQLQIACTKTLVVDYYRPWSGNFNPDLKALQCGTKNNWRYPFMDQIVNKKEHSEIAELRNKLIAHIELDYEAIALTVKGASVSNVSQQQNTIPETFLPRTTYSKDSTGNLKIKCGF